MIRKQIEDKELADRIAQLPEDKRCVIMLSGGQVRLTGLAGTCMLNQMRANHNLGILETYVLGQAYIAAGLMASSVKGNDRIQLSVECGGPIGGFSVESWACGAVRGYIKNNPIHIDRKLESSDLSMLYGPGFINVSKIIEGSRTPFTGQIMMEYGNLAKDLALYYTQSEQTPTLFSISVNLDKKGRVAGAGGLFIQAMPGCSEEILEQLQEKSSVLPSLGSAISSGKDITDYCTENFTEYGVQILAKAPVMFSCPCSRQNFAQFLSQMPQKEKQEILEDKKFPLELECFNCGTVYSFTEEEITEIFR